MYQKEIEYIENIYKWNEKNATIQVIYIWKSKVIDPFIGV